MRDRRSTSELRQLEREGLLSESGKSELAERTAIRERQEKREQGAEKTRHHLEARSKEEGY
jgi:hypothetical protein